jgi:hypothetical protein
MSRLSLSIVFVMMSGALPGCGCGAHGARVVDGGGSGGTGGAAGSGAGGMTGGTGGTMAQTGGSGAAGGTGGVAMADAAGGTGGTGGTPPPPPRVTIGMPMSPDSWSAAPATTGPVPVIVYPSDQTRFPRNIYRTLFQWRSQGYTQFRVNFDGPTTDVTLFTDGRHPLCQTKPGAACWEADEMAWSYIAGANAGETVVVTVDGLDASTTPATIRRSAPITVGFSRQKVEGAIFYWSTTSAGIRRANISAAVPEDYITGKPSTSYAIPADQVKCVACHVVSRDGKYMLAPVSAASGNSLWIMEVTREAPPTPLVKNVPSTSGKGFATISPDDERVVAAWNGKMWMLDRATGATMGSLPLGAMSATHPDWSPDGKQLVFANAKGDAPSGASLATITYSNGTWGVPKVIVPAAGSSNLFPMHSPDAAWIAYSRGKGGHGDLTAQLWLVAAAGGTPTELLNANRVVSNQMGDGQTENSQPTWAPPGDYQWIAFNSQREYGLVLPKGTQQIWVAAIDPAKAAQGMDPSYPAFRLQFQGLEEDNHRAFWTLDVRDPAPPVDAGTPAPDASPSPPACVRNGNSCNPQTDMCCDPSAQCSAFGGGYTCIVPIQ